MKSEPKPGDANDIALLERIKSGDEDAFAQFYDRLSPLLHGLVCKVLNDPKEAEDVVQEGFMHIWKKASSYDANRSSPLTWAVMIFRHRAIDRLRSRQRHAHHAERAALEPTQWARSDDDNDRVINLQERGTVVRSALQQISAEQRESISLAFFEGLTQAQIATKLGEPLGTIKARIRRGLLKLRESINGKL